MALSAPGGKKVSSGDRGVNSKVIRHGFEEVTSLARIPRLPEQY